jgi:threonine/homoserine efflux transporter RhtA
MFSAKLMSLEPCESTHSGLALLRDRPTLRGVLTIEGEIDLITKLQDS